MRGRLIERERLRENELGGRERKRERPTMLGWMWELKVGERETYAQIHRQRETGRQVGRCRRMLLAGRR